MIARRPRPARPPLAEHEGVRPRASATAFLEWQRHPAIPGDPPRSRTVSGYRLVRKLGEGERCEVHLAIPDAGAADAPHPVALKVARPGVSAASVLVEADALSRANHPHVVQLVDVAQDAGPDAEPGGYLRVTLPAPCLVLERLPRGSLATLLHSREYLKPGEAVTIIGPVLDAVSALHAAGVVHGGITASSVFFRESGAPVLCRFGTAALIPPGLPPAALDGLPGVRADRRDLARLIAVVLERVDCVKADAVPATTTAVVELVDEVEALASATGEWGARELASVAERLFALAAAAPIDFSPPLAALDSAASTGASHAVRVPAGVRGRSTLVTAERGENDVYAAATALVSRMRNLGALARPRFWLTAGGVGLALVVALLAIPGGGSDGAGASRPSAPPVALQQQKAVTSERAKPTVPKSRARNSAALQADDPVSATVVLIAARADCFAQLSDQCFAGVDQAGSAALQSDLALVRDVRNGGELPESEPVSAASVTLVQRLGDSSLLTLGKPGAHSKPASILVMWTEAGWRIRDYLEE